MTFDKYYKQILLTELLSIIAKVKLTQIKLINSTYRPAFVFLRVRVCFLFERQTPLATQNNDIDAKKQV